MKVPIPDDWDGQSWICAQIEWPNSPQWIAILLGFLSQATRGRFWDEQTGSILDTQAIGWQIWDRNFPLTDCEGLPGQPLTPEQENFIGCMLDLGDDDMPCIDISGMLKVENGILYAKNSCCEWVEIGDFTPGSSSPALTDDPLNPTHDPGFTYSACGKADALVTKLIAVGQSAWNARDDPPWQYTDVFHSDHPDLSGGDIWFIDGVVEVLQLDILSSYEDIFDQVEMGRLRAWLESVLPADKTGLSETLFDQMKDKIVQINGGINPLDPVGIAKGNFWQLMLNAIGPGDANNIVMLGAGNTTANCDSPIEWPSIPAIYDWVHHYDFSIGQYAWTDIGNFYVPFVGFINPDVDQFEQLPGVSKSAVGGPGSVVYIAALVDVWPSGTLGGGASPFWFEIGTSFWDPDLRGTLDWIATTQTFNYIVGTLFKVFNMQFDQAGVSGVSKWHRLVIAGTGTDPFPSDPV